MRLGTRGSALALAQAQPIATALGAEVVVIKTSGDLGAPATGPTDKERWVDAIEQALLEDRIDVAVHSAKDVPGALADGLELVAAAGRVDPSDALIGASSIDELPHGARVGTSSPRRRAQLLAARDDLEVVELAGNVDTRLARLAAGEADAIVLATAGLVRLGREREIGAILDPAVFVPAPGQGTLALEAKAGFDASAVADPAALKSLETERELARLLGATCHSAVGILSDGPSIRVWIGSIDGADWIHDETIGETPAVLAARAISLGAHELLASG